MFNGTISYNQIIHLQAPSPSTNILKNSLENNKKGHRTIVLQAMQNIIFIECEIISM
jgi:hypothetical protein